MPLIAYPSRTQLAWAPADYLNAVHAADGGNPSSLAQFVSAILKDDRIGGVTETRVKGMLSLPSTIEVADGSSPPTISDWSTVFPEAEQETLLTWGLILGFGWARKERKWNPIKERWEMKILTWDPKWFTFRDHEQAWYVQARSIIKEGTYGRPIFRKVSPVDGWIFYTPFGEVNPWQRGLCHRLAVPYLAKTYAIDDRSREGEVTTILAGTTVGLSEPQRQGFLDDLQGLARDSRIVLPQGCDIKAVSRKDAVSATIHQETITWADQAATITIAGQLTTTEGSEGFSSGQVQKQVLSSLLRSQEETFSTTVGEQALTDWARLSVDWTGAMLYPRWLIQDPNDLTAQGFAAKQLSDSIEGINRALAVDNVRVDIRSVMERTGIPITPVTVVTGGDASRKFELAPTDIARAISVNEARASLGYQAEAGGERKLAEVAQAQEIETVAAEEAITEKTRARYRRFMVRPKGPTAIATRTRKGNIQLRNLSQAKPYALVDENPPERFLLFDMGENPSDKGTAILTPEGIKSIFGKLGSRDVTIDLEHLSLDRECVNYDPDARGWLRLEADEAGLWAAETKWTTDGTRRLREKLQRYVSPAFYMDKNRVIVELVNIALTSLPATTYGQPLVAASKGSKMDTEQLMAVLREKLGLAEDATIEQLMVAMLDAIGPTEEPPAAEPPATEPAALADEDEDDPPKTLVDEDEDDPPKTLANEDDDEEGVVAAMKLATKANKRARAVEKKLNAQEKDAVIRANRRKLPGKLTKWARKVSLEALQDFLVDAPELNDDSFVEPVTEAVKLSREDEALCEKFGTKPETILAIRKRDAARG